MTDSDTSDSPLSPSTDNRLRLLDSGILHRYQIEGARFLIDNPKSNLWWKPGQGKTLTVLTMLDEIRPKRTLLVAPLRCCHSVWPQEIKKWAPHMSWRLATGSPSLRIRDLRARADIHIINYEKLLWLIQELPDVFYAFDCIIFDEASKLKNPQSKRFKAIRKPIQAIPRVHGLTGTPAPNGLLDVWSQVYVLDGGQALGTPYSRYRERFFDSDYMGYNWTVKDPDRIYRRLEGLCHVRNVDPDVDLLQIPVPIRTRTPAYEAMRKDGYAMGIMAETAAAVQMKLRQMSNGFVYDEDGEPHEIHYTKLSALQDLVEELGGQPVVVFYEFQEDFKRLQEAFPQAIPFSDDVVDRWNRGKIEVLLMNPASGGYGLNMQEFGNNIVWYGPPWDLELHDQAIARLWRQGQKAQAVYVYYLTGDDTLDPEILEVLKMKDRDQAALLSALERHRKVR